MVKMSFVQCKISPLFELSASFHLLASTQVTQRHQNWVSQTLRSLSREQLLEEWRYFSPVFSKVIPWILHPDKTKEVVDSEEMMDYLMELPVDHLREAFVESLYGDKISEVKDPFPVEVDLQQDPDFVKARFTLFCNSYWETIFSITWERISPLLAKEKMQLEQACLSAEHFRAFLDTLPNQNSLAEIYTQPAARSIQLLYLYPSSFYHGQPAFHLHASSGHFLYNIMDRTVMHR